MIIFLDVMPKHIKIKAYELNSVGFNNFNGILIFYMGYEQLLYVSIRNLGPISQDGLSLVYFATLWLWPVKKLPTAGLLP